MIDLMNAITIAICSFISGMAFHSLWLHAKKRKELEDWHKIEHEGVGDGT